MPIKPTCQPRWTLLSIILALAIGLLAMESLTDLTPAGHKLALLAIIMLVYGLVGLWIQSNAQVLEEPPANRPREIWRVTGREWNNGKEVAQETERLGDERTLDTIEA